MNLDYFFSGLDTQAYKYMGCHKLGDGVEFYVWAPHAKKVEVFTSREDFRVFYPFEKVDDRGIWHLVIENCECIYSYRYRITCANNSVIEKSDPYAFYSERRPSNASVMYDLSQYQFTDKEYMDKRNFSYENPLNIYEVHVNGFKHEGELTTYRELKEELIPYVKQIGYLRLRKLAVLV